MKKVKYLLILGILFAANNVGAATGVSACNYGEKNADRVHSLNENIIVVDSYRETTNTTDEFDTIDRNTTIIGKTKFTSDQVITAYKASQAGYDYGVLVSSSSIYYNDPENDYLAYPTVYIYYGEVGGWYSLDQENNATSISDSATLEKLNSQNIYAVNNNLKGIYVGNYSAEDAKYCVNNGIYIKNYDETTKTADYYVSSFADISLNLDRTSKLVYDKANSKYSMINYSIEIVDVDNSVSGQVKIYIKDTTNNNYISGQANIEYTNGNVEVIEIKQNGYLILNKNSISKIYDVKI